MNIKSTVVFKRLYESYTAVSEENDDKKYRQIVLVGGSRSSKSISILQLLLIDLITRKNIKIAVWRETKVTCRATIMEDFQKIISQDDDIYKDIKYNKRDSVFTYLPTNSKIVFTGADDIGKVLGSQQDISFFNEVTEFNKFIYLQIAQRTSDRILCDYNPSKDFWLEKYRNNPNTIFLHSTFKDNHFCPLEIVKQLLSYEPWECDSYKVSGSSITYNGINVSLSNKPPIHKINDRNGTADVYMWKVYGLGLGAEKPSRIYKGWKTITEAYFDSLDYTSFFGMDFGTANPTACVEIKYNGNGGFLVRERLYLPVGDSLDALPTILKTQVPTLGKGDIIVCDSAKQSFINVLLRSGYTALPADKGGGSIEAGISLCQSVNIFYVPSEHLDYEYENYSWEIDRYGKAVDIPVKKDDHLMDAVRYLIDYMVKYYGVNL